ncbi:MAG TPA: arginine--tRNA ligase [Patescibacteria group bacterium]|nr:arginine--tRNA ligase [Patescibacteria group bacterium]
MKKTILEKIRNIVNNLTNEEVVVDIAVPKDNNHGDYTTNVALQFAKKIGRNPLEIAQEISKQIGDIKGVEKTEIVTPGFINFYLAKEMLIKRAQNITESPEKIVAMEKVKVPQFEEYENVGPNTNKPLHIGHLRNTAYGESVVTLRKSLGNKVWSVNINNDRGIAIIKAMWGYLQYGKIVFEDKKTLLAYQVTEPESWEDLLNAWIQDYNNALWHENWRTPQNTKQKSDHFLGFYYILGDKAEKVFAQTATNQMKAMLLAWEAGNKQVRLLWRVMNDFFYDGFRQTHARFLGISPKDKQFDKEYYESELYEAGKQIILDNIGKGLFYKREDGVIMADLKKYNLPDKVTIRSDGSSLYITFDLEEARQMSQIDKADLIAHVVADEQDLYWKQVFAIVDALKIAPKKHLLHLAYGFLDLKGGQKMSSREGNVITADDLMDFVKGQIKKLFADVSDEIAEQIAIGSIKWALLKHNPKARISFDINESISLQGNSGPYIQYSYVRTQSILAKSHTTGVNKEFSVNSVFQDIELNVDEMQLLRKLYQFPSIVQQAAITYGPNIVCEYLFSLSQQYNLFYQKYRILNATRQIEKEFRLLLTQAIGVILHQGLGLLGIATPAHM